MELARVCAARGYRVFGTTRGPSDALNSVSGVTAVEGIDIGDDSCSDLLAQAMGETKIGLLIVNAGVLSVENLADMDTARIYNQFNINTLGPVRVIKGLVNNLESGSKVAFMSSRMGSISDTGGGMYGYRASKAGINAIGKAMSGDLKERGVSVTLLHPGMVATDMTAQFGHDNAITTEVSVAGMMEQLDAVTIEQTGKFLAFDGRELGW